MTRRLALLLILLASLTFGALAQTEIVQLPPASIPIIPLACGPSGSEVACLVYIAQRLLSLDQESNQEPDALRVLVYVLPLFAFFIGTIGGASVAGTDR